MSKPLLAGAAFAALIWSCPVGAKPVTVDTLLDLETFGRIQADPTSRWVVVEWLKAQSDWPRYDYAYEGGVRYADLFLGRLDHGAILTSLLPAEADTGYSVGGFSPDGRRLAMFRLRDDQWRLGIIDLDSRAVRWTDVSPLTPQWGRALEWTSNTRLLVLGTVDGSLPPGLARGRLSQDRLPKLWARAALGLDSFVISETGPDRSSVPPPGEAALWAVDARDGQATQLARGDFMDLELSYDRRTVAVLVDGPPERNEAGSVVAEVRRKRSLLLVDLETGRSHRPEGVDDIAPGLLAWSPVASELIVFSREADQFLRISGSGQVQPLALGDLAPWKPMLDGVGIQPQAGWIDGDPVVRATRGGSGRADWWRIGPLSPVNLTPSVAAPGGLRAQFVDGVAVADGARVVALDGAGRPRELGDAAGSPSSDGYGVRAMTDAMKRDAVLVRRGDSLCRATAVAAMTCLAKTPPGVVAADWSDGTVLRLEQDAQGVSRLVAGGGEGPGTALMTLNPELEAVAFPEPRRIDAAGVSGWLYLPTEGAGPFPVIVIPYPGRVHTEPPAEMRPGARSVARTGQPLVAAGYAVLYPDLPVEAEPAERLAARILAVVDVAAVDAPIDTRRIGLWGWSFGAWASVLAAAQSERIGAVVALNGAYDPFSVLGSTDQAARVAGRMQTFAVDNARWLETGQAGMDVPYWQDPERYRRGSAAIQADEIQAPVLLLSGDMDFSVAQAELMFGALNRLDRPAALITFFGEEHALWSPANLKQMYAQTIGWFDRYLKGDVASTPAAIASGEARPPSGPG